MTGTEAKTKLEIAYRALYEIDAEIRNGAKRECDSCGASRYENQTSWQIKQLATTALEKMAKIAQRIESMPDQAETL